MDRKINIILNDIFLYNNHNNIIIIDNEKVDIVYNILKYKLNPRNIYKLDGKEIKSEDIKNIINGLNYYNGNYLYLLIKNIDYLVDNLKNLIEKIDMNVKFIFFCDNYNRLNASGTNYNIQTFDRNIKTDLTINNEDYIKGNSFIFDIDN